MFPFQPPLPTAWNLPFQPDAGSQTSILMSDSLEGVSVAATRQKAGRSLNGLPPPRPAGAVNAPAATGCAIVIVASGSFNDDRLSQVAALAGPAWITSRAAKPRVTRTLARGECMLMRRSSRMFCRVRRRRQAPPGCGAHCAAKGGYVSTMALGYCSGQTVTFRAVSKWWDVCLEADPVRIEDRGERMTLRPIGRVVVVVFVVGLAAALSAAQGPNQPPPRDSAAAPPQTGAATIRGRIVEADTGRPLRRSRATLTGPGLPRQGLVTSTDEAGRYEFSRLPAGRFTLTAQRSGYLQLRYGQRRSEEHTSELQSQSNLVCRLLLEKKKFKSLRHR